jgi:hypothetical protein
MLKKCISIISCTLITSVQLVQRPSATELRLQESRHSLLVADSQQIEPGKDWVQVFIAVVVIPTAIGTTLFKSIMFLCVFIS